jgi:hypothetical protein
VTTGGLPAFLVLDVENERPAFAGLSVVELAGLEPATSWVRSRCSPN